MKHVLFISNSVQIIKHMQKITYHVTQINAVEFLFSYILSVFKISVLFTFLTLKFIKMDFSWMDLSYLAVTFLMSSSPCLIFQNTHTTHALPFIYCVWLPTLHFRFLDSIIFNFVDSHIFWFFCYYSILSLYKCRVCSTGLSTSFISATPFHKYIHSFINTSFLALLKERFLLVIPQTDSSHSSCHPNRSYVNEFSQTFLIYKSFYI